VFLEPNQPKIHLYWTGFNKFYQTFLEDIDYFLAPPELKKEILMSEDPELVSPEIQHFRKQMFAYNFELTRVPEISANLMCMMRILKEEDKRENFKASQEGHNQGAMGENLEYFIENKIIEQIGAYILTD